MSANLPNIHATGLIVGDRGMVIRGASGAGKTTLALSLIEAAQRRGWFAALIADDQLFVETRGACLLAMAPGSIAGLAEAYGVGPRAIVHRPAGLIDLVVDLVEADTPRFQDSENASVAGISVPLLRLGARHSRQATAAIAAWFGWPPFRA